jgi:hypothetical protein
MNIKILVTSHDVGSINPTSKELNPAVRGMTEAKILSTIFWEVLRRPSVFGLFHSRIAMAKVPRINKARLAHKTIREFKDHCLGIV